MLGVLALFLIAFSVAYLSYKITTNLERKARMGADSFYDSNTEQKVINALPQEGVMKFYINGAYLLNTVQEFFGWKDVQPYRVDIDPEGTSEYTVKARVNGVDAAVSFRCKSMDAANFRFSGGESVESYVVDGKLQVVERLTVAMAAKPDPTAALRDIRATLKESELSHVTPSVDTERLNVYELARDNGEYYFKRVTKPTTFLDNELLGASYEPVTVSYKAQTHRISLTELMPVLVEEIGKNRNFIINGPPGSGKTTLLNNIAARAAEMDSRTRIVRLTDAVMTELQSPDLRSVLLDFATEGPIIFIYDEAQTSKDADYTPLFELMEGGSKLENSSVIAVMDTSSKQIPEALTRKGRAQMILTTTALSAGRATKLKGILQQRYGATHTFDVDTMREMINNTQWGQSRTAPSGQIMLCDVWSCLIEKEIESTLDRILAKSVVGRKPMAKTFSNN